MKRLEPHSFTGFPVPPDVRNALDLLSELNTERRISSAEHHILVAGILKRRSSLDVGGGFYPEPAWVMLQLGVSPPPPQETSKRSGGEIAQR